MAVKVIRGKKQKRKETIIFAILCFIIVLLLGANIWAICNLIESKKIKGSPSIVCDNQSVMGFVMKLDEPTSDGIIFEKQPLNPGDETTKEIRLVNNGGDDLYLRLSLVFEISLDSINFEEVDFLTFSVKDVVNWTKNDVDDKYYSLIKLSKHDYLDINTIIKIKDELQQDDNFEQYKDKHYKITIHVDTLNASEVISTETPQDIIQSWGSGE